MRCAGPLRHWKQGLGGSGRRLDRWTTPGPAAAGSPRRRSARTARPRPSSKRPASSSAGWRSCRICGMRSARRARASWMIWPAGQACVPTGGGAGVPGRRVPAPGLQHRRLDPVQRRPHRLVMRADYRPVAARAVLRRQQRRQRHRLRGRKRDVETGTVLVLAGAHPAEADLSAQHMALQQLLEFARRDPLARLQAERRRALPVPRARLAVLLPLRLQLLRALTLLKIVAALVAEILRSGRRRGQVADRRYHDPGS